MIQLQPLIWGLVDGGKSRNVPEGEQFFTGDEVVHRSSRRLVHVGWDSLGEPAHDQ